MGGFARSGMIPTNPWRGRVRTTFQYLAGRPQNQKTMFRISGLESPTSWTLASFLVFGGGVPGVQTPVPNPKASDSVCATTAPLAQVQTLIPRPRAVAQAWPKPTHLPPVWPISLISNRISPIKNRARGNRPVEKPHFPCGEPSPRSWQSQPAMALF